ncbi:MAG: peptide chain release factor N(5)-glutamine methyltransferase [Deltaproteobacteria bacterium]|nr:peptide chain release factor N(5)-glutamine methyltransferase [Deltaproteobacteria bacterium]MBI3387550.1 peptide chain release factor N(5)-glutamine methyltransferase [Deltaproteobacteria bacterium]
MTPVAELSPPATAADVLAAATARLARAGIDTARLDAEVLLAHALGRSRTHLLAALRDTLPDGAAAAFEPLLARRIRREPVAYITGRQEFWSLDFVVGPDVLIPRPETELMVEIVARWLREHPTAHPRVADIGTGSGCIAVALAHEVPSAEVWASDLSPAALAVARVNAERLGVAARIRFVAGDLLAPLTDAAPFDLICSNPPYVAMDDSDALQPELGYEPATALFADGDGLAVIRQILLSAPALLTRSGALLIEIGCGQADTARALAAAAGFGRVEIRADYAGIPRVLVASEACCDG